MTDRVLPHDSIIHVAGHELHRHVVVPDHPPGVAIVARTSGDDTRDARIARALEARGVATVVVEMIGGADEDLHDGAGAIGAMADRIVETVDWVAGDVDLGALPIGLVGCGPSTAAALTAAVRRPAAFSGIVCCDGQPDLATGDVAAIRAPTLYAVGVGDEAGAARLAEWLINHLEAAGSTMSRRGLGDPVC